LKKEHTVEDVEKLLPLKTWWASVFVLPLSNRIALYISNNTGITPNQVTLFSLFLRVATGFSFIQGTKGHLILGALFYYVAYTLDCVDGLIARLTGRTSEFGRYLDHISDLVGDLFILFGLAYGQGILFEPLVLAMMFAHVTEYYISFLTSNILKVKTGTSVESINPVFQMINSYRNFFFTRNYKSFLSFPDYEAVVFILFPLIGKPMTGIKVGFYLVLAIVLYTIFSSFVTIMTGGEKFP